MGYKMAIGLVFLVLLVAGCTQPLPEPGPAPGPTPTPTTEPEPTPTTEPEPTPTTEPEPTPTTEPEPTPTTEPEPTPTTEPEPTPTTEPAPTQEPSTGNLLLSITDKQVEGLEELHVTISSIEVHKAGDEGNGDANAVDGNEDTNSEDSDNGGSWILFSEEEQTFDIMQLDSNLGLKAILGEQELEAGKYTQVRLSVTSVRAVIDGNDFNVDVPSQTIKLVRSFDVNANETTEIIIDFSPESVIQTGNTYKLKPVIHLITPKEFEALEVEPEVEEGDEGGEEGGDVNATDGNTADVNA